MFRIAIVEDDPAQQEQLKHMLGRYARERTCQLEIVTFQDGADLVECYAQQYHIVFLDIQMRVMNGLEAAARIREADQQVRLIFLPIMPTTPLTATTCRLTVFWLSPPAILSLPV